LLFGIAVDLRVNTFEVGRTTFEANVGRALRGFGIANAAPSLSQILSNSISLGGKDFAAKYQRNASHEMIRRILSIEHSMKSVEQ
jgi:hypothetical protein